MPEVPLYTGILQKDVSSFRFHDKLLVILMLQAEGCFRYPSATLHFVLRRTENRLAEIEKSFGWELFIAFRNERKLKDTLSIFHLVTCYMIVFYRITWKMKHLFPKFLGGDAVQRSKGQSFLSLQTNKNLCLIKESLRFLRWPIRLVSRLNPKKEENPLKVIDFQGI